MRPIAIAVFSALLAFSILAPAQERPSRSGDRERPRPRPEEQTPAEVRKPGQWSYPLHVLPPENRRVIDPVTGVELTYLTTNTPSRNLYFHDRSWTADGAMILFKNTRGGPSMVTAYIVATGELVPLDTPEGPIKSATGASRRNTIIGMRGNDLVELTPKIDAVRDSAGHSRVTITERRIGTFPVSAQPSVNLNDQYVALGRFPSIWVMDVRTGAVRELVKLGPDYDRLQHIQFSRTNPNLLTFATGPDKHIAGRPDRLWVVDIREGLPRVAYHAAPGELVTHESWWVNDQILFCGGYVPEDTVGEISHVKVLDVHTGLVRIVGAGAWWPGGATPDIWRRNWWHASGSEDGRWIAGDTFHGDIVLFDGRTTVPRLLTAGHRTYGGGEHPEVGWDRTGRHVIFASNKPEGGPWAVVATIPESWRAEGDSLFAGPSVPREMQGYGAPGTPRRNR